MLLLRSNQHLPKLQQSTIATVGNFDGVHKGHQEIIKFLVDQSKQEHLKSLLICFEPTPKEFFLGDKSPPRLTPLREKLELTRMLGIDYFVCLRFNQSLSEMPAENFVNHLLYENLNIKHLIVGDDFRFGHDRKGNIGLLRKQADVLGFKVTDQSTIDHEDTRISSSLVREKLAMGDFNSAATLLNRPFTISGKVFHGDKKGRTIGFPTANILLKRRVSPVLGVFTVTANTKDNSWNGIANVGHRPTVNGQRKQLEVHLFGCDEDLYGRRLTVCFHARLREEKKFPSFDELKQQISLDVEQAKNYFKKVKE